MPSRWRETQIVMDRPETCWIFGAMDKAYLLTAERALQDIKNSRPIVQLRKGRRWKSVRAGGEPTHLSADAGVYDKLGRAHGVVGECGGSRTAVF